VGTTCLVTIHGIGFQQPPDDADGTPGYADALHEHLSQHLDAELSDDPQRTRSTRGQHGPIYVASEWPPSSRNVEDGLSRLGTWASRSDRLIDATNAPLTDGVGRIAHVALVYSRLEDMAPQPGSTLEIAVRAVLASGHYASVASLAQMALSDTWAVLHERAASLAGVTTSLKVRSAKTGTMPVADVLTTIRALEDDVAVYVTNNDLRTRVRSFVREALLRLCSRDDVDTIVVNSHSQGTVLGYDVLHDLPPFLMGKVKVFVTAGSPLRKYVDLFAWGTEIGCVAAVDQWRNFWDGTDPVADPLVPPADWHRGDAPPPPPDPNDPNSVLFQEVNADTGAIAPATVEDVLVDNIAKSAGGGLQAHNYWDNDPQFVQPLADLLRGVTT
jgi:hypothetical protein